jgi:hypothetical protein
MWDCPCWKDSSEWSAESRATWIEKAYSCSFWFLDESFYFKVIAGSPAVVRNNTKGSRMLVTICPNDSFYLELHDNITTRTRLETLARLPHCPSEPRSLPPSSPALLASTDWFYVRVIWFSQACHINGIIQFLKLWDSLLLPNLHNSLEIPAGHSCYKHLCTGFHSPRKSIQHAGFYGQHV